MEYDVGGAIKVPVVSRRASYDSNILVSHYNSAVLYSANDSIVQIHNKMRLTPFAEGFPYVEYLPFARDLFV